MDEKPRDFDNSQQNIRRASSQKGWTGGSGDNSVDDSHCVGEEWDSFSLKIGLMFAPESALILRFHWRTLDCPIG